MTAQFDFELEFFAAIEAPATAKRVTKATRKAKKAIQTFNSDKIDYSGDIKKIQQSLNRYAKKAGQPAFVGWEALINEFDPYSYNTAEISSYLWHRIGFNGQFDGEDFDCAQRLCDAWAHESSVNYKKQFRGLAQKHIAAYGASRIR